MKNINFQPIIKSFLTFSAAVIFGSSASMAQPASAVYVTKIDNHQSNALYVNNRLPLKQSFFIKLPTGSIKAGGWLKKVLELQRDGLTGNLGEISIWLSKTNNAWLNKEGKGEYGWEELPYWLKGYANIGYMLGDQKMIAESKFWIDAVLNNQRSNGDFGPDRKKNGNRDLWTNMPMLWCLQSHYEFSGDPRVIPFMTRYFKYELSVTDDQFLEDYWEKSRGGDNLSSVYWLYNHTGEPFLLDLAAKIDKNTDNWRQANNLPNWHNVNIAQGFREPATFYLQSQDSKDLDATYNDFNFIRSEYGQMPGGMFAADENARKGFNDPRQAVETCGMVEQMTSDQMLLGTTGDSFWAENCEDVAFNTFPAAFMPDYKSLRYLTAPNMVISDGKNHHPGIDNNGPFLMMNPFSSRCCQHNHAAGWVYYAENSWMATPDNGIAALLYTQGQVSAKVGNGTAISITETTRYPFADQVSFKVNTPKPVEFPLYLRVPAWCKNASVSVNGVIVKTSTSIGDYIKISNSWKDGDQITLQLPMKLAVRTWENNKNSVSINYGPLTYSLKIEEQYLKKQSTATAISDSRWQAGASPDKWPSYEIQPASAWNYGLVIDKTQLENSIEISKREWPKDDNPFTNTNAPIELKVKGKKIPDWTIDQYGLCGLLPQSPVKTTEVLTPLTLVPMGGARLRITAFPEVK
jgi:hypothetical protein